MKEFITAVVSLIATVSVHHSYSAEIDYNSRALPISQVNDVYLRNQIWCGAIVPLRALAEAVKRADIGQKTLGDVVHPVRVRFSNSWGQLTFGSFNLLDPITNKMHCTKWLRESLSDTQAIFKFEPKLNTKVVINNSGTGESHNVPQLPYNFGILYLDTDEGLYISAQSRSLTILISNDVASKIRLDRYCENVVKPALTKLDLELDVSDIVNQLIPVLRSSPFQPKEAID